VSAGSQLLGEKRLDSKTTSSRLVTSGVARVNDTPGGAVGAKSHPNAYITITIWQRYGYDPATIRHFNCDILMRAPRVLMRTIRQLRSRGLLHNEKKEHVNFFVERSYHAE
jgi:hypothetical protein